MTDADKAPFAVVMARCAEVFQFQLSDGLLAEYFKALTEHPLRQVRWAIEQCITDCLFFPKPKDILTAMFHERHEGEIQRPARPMIAAPCSENIRKENLAKIKAILNRIDQAHAAQLVTNDEEVRHYAAIGAQVIDTQAVTKAYNDAVAKVRKKYAKA